MTGKPRALIIINEYVRNPRWWFEEVVAALIIGGLVASGTILGQKIVDDRRSERELGRALEANRHDLQMENLRFVRERSFDSPAAARRFAEFDLEGQNLVGLQLAGADFARADLAGANLAEVDLSGANLARADLADANLTQARLRGSYLGPERIRDAPDRRGADLAGADLTDADLTDADLSHTNLAGANLERTRLVNVFYDSRTAWPAGFTPPPSRPSP